MALRDQFEPLLGAIVHQSPLPSDDGAVRELIAEGTRFKVSNVAPPAQSVFVTPTTPPSQYSAPLLPALGPHLIQVTGKPKPRVAMDETFD